MARERNAIDMSVGISEFNCPPELAELAANNIRGSFNYDAPSDGLFSLREHISGIYSERYGPSYSPETEIIICSGAVQAMSSAITTVVNEGDEVIIFDPAYFTYPPAVKLNGGMPVYVPLAEPDFKIDWDDVKKMITSKTRLIIMNTPHNPCGSVFGKDDMLNLQRLTNGTGIYVISDESFEYLIYDSEKHQSAGQFPNLAARSFIISTPGPAFHINGWGLAWCMAPEKLMTEFRKIHEYQVYNAVYPLQQALSDYLVSHHNFEDVTEFYQGKRNYFNRLFKGSPYKIHPSGGTYFQLLDYREVSGETDTDFAIRLLNEAGVAAMPLSVFRHNRNPGNYLRFCFSKKNETLDEVARRMIDFAANATTE